jgi:hypothetical protein
MNLYIYTHTHTLCPPICDIDVLALFSLHQHLIHTCLSRYDPELDGRILLGKVDCTQEPDLCRRYFLGLSFLTCRFLNLFCGSNFRFKAFFFFFFVICMQKSKYIYDSIFPRLLRHWIYLYDWILILIELV